MTQLTIFRGISGSGKSTRAAASALTCVVVSRDAIRMLLFGTEEFRDEGLVTRVEHSMIREALLSGRDVISDNTNIEWKYVLKIADIGRECDADVQLKVFDVDYKTAIARNDRRAMAGGRNVPESVIRRQYDRLQKTIHYQLPTPVQIEPYSENIYVPSAAIFDMDGTLANGNFGQPGKRGPYDEARVGEDDLRNHVVNQAYMHEEAGDSIIIVSGRSDGCYSETLDWLIDKAEINVDHLFMRKSGDTRPDDVVKLEIFNNNIRNKFNIRAVYDDRWQVCKLWLKLGLPLFNVSGLDRGEF